MKNLYILLMICLFFTTVHSQTEYTSGAEYCSQQKQLKTLAKTTENFLRVPPAGNPGHSFDVLNYTLNLDLFKCFISPYRKSFTGSVTIKLRADSALNFIQLNAVNTSLSIDSVNTPGSSFTHESNILRVNLNRTYNAGETLDIKIYYKHKNVNDYAFYSSNGFVFTDCEPEGARHWFPCWDRPSDKATTDITVKTPINVKLGSNGRLADSILTSDDITYRWVSRDPVATYLIVLAGKKNYNLDIIYWQNPKDTQQTLPIRFYWNQGEKVSSINNIKAKIIPMTSYFSELFGLYPFEKNGFATLNSSFQLGGMENQTLTTLCPGCWIESLIAHEFAHQWFGDMISPATWADLWLSEGFATYAEALWDEYTGDTASYRRTIESQASSYLMRNPGWAIYNPSWAINTPNNDVLFDIAITYFKSSVVIHMLRYVLGDQMFFSLIKTYTSDDGQYKHRNVLTEDFIRTVNSSTGQNYSWFFDQWIRQPNHPVYSNTYLYYANSDSTWTLVFKTKQTQTNAPFFSMPLELKIQFTDRTDTLVRVFNSTNNETFSFTFNREPLSLTFDPNNNIPLKKSATNFHLPVELSSFTVRSERGLVHLEWKTATEKNNWGFEIQRHSLKEGGWVTTGFVKGHGTTAEPNIYSFYDHPVNLDGQAVSYRLKQIDFDGSFSLSCEEEIIIAPSGFSLEQNYPNPFNPSTVIRYSLPSECRVKISVINSIGEVLSVPVDQVQSAGSYSIPWNAGSQSSGIYFCRIETRPVNGKNGYSAVRKMLLLK